MSPPDTTSLESWPTTWPSCIANSVPPTLRMIWLAPAIMSSMSSGALSLSTSVSELAIDVATGSASWVQTGIVASTHSWRLISFGAAVSSGTEVTSSSHRDATCSACSSCERSAGSDTTVPRPAMPLACSEARPQLMPSPECCSACCNWVMSCLTISGSLGSPAAPTSLAGSMSVFPSRNARSMSRNSSSLEGSSSGPRVARESSGMRSTLAAAPSARRCFDLG